MAKTQETKRTMSPATLRVLLHHYYSPESFPEATPAVIAAYEQLMGNNLLEDAEPLEVRKPGYANVVITERGRVFEDVQ